MTSHGSSGLPAEGPWFLQGWFPGRRLAGALADGGALGLVRVEAFPDLSELASQLEELRGVGLDLKGVREKGPEILELAKARGAAFICHGRERAGAFLEALKATALPRLVFVRTVEDAVEAAETGPTALVVEGGRDQASRLAEIHRRTGLPLLPEVDRDAESAQQLLDLPGVRGLQVRTAALLRSLSPRLAGLAAAVAGDDQDPLPSLRIGSLELEHPVLQGGMGLGVSWDGLAGEVARCGGGGTVSAIGTGYREEDAVECVQGRPLGAANLHHGPSLEGILRRALDRAEGRGAVGVNILCAINGYEEAVRASVAGGAQYIVSGAGLPLTLPGLVAGADVALIPIVSSARALGVICKSWQRRYGRLPDAVVLEGPESGGHQGFSKDQIGDAHHSLESLLPEVVAERDRWGTFPVIAAGGVWDRSDIERMLALGAGGVQMATRFIGTLECDAAQAFKDVILKAAREDIRLVSSPVGMPGRAVATQLQTDILEGTAPKIRCISDCVSPCAHGEGARQAGYCIADRLEDARQGRTESGLFFSGSNGWRLKDLVSVRELMAEVTGAF